MKKIIVALLILAMMIMVVGCNTTETPSNDEVNLSECKQGDSISISGQVAGSTLINGNTLWVQVKQGDGSFVIYHCQMKEEFIEAAESLKILDVVKVTGLFLSYVDLGQENTSPVATLYDCEIK